jgi:hypothetical protein
VVDKKRIMGGKGAEEEEDRHKGSLTDDHWRSCLLWFVPNKSKMVKK